MLAYISMLANSLEKSTDLIRADRKGRKKGHYGGTRGMALNGMVCVAGLRGEHLCTFEDDLSGHSVT